MRKINIEDIRPILSELIENFGGDIELKMPDKLSAIGIDSLTTINIILGIAENFEIDISLLDETVEAPETFGNLIDIVNGMYLAREGS